MSEPPKNEYDWVTDKMFERELSRIVREEALAGTILSVPGVYEACSEHFNNEVLRRLEDKRR